MSLSSCLLRKEWWWLGFCSNEHVSVFLWAAANRPSAPSQEETIFPQTCLSSSMFTRVWWLVCRVTWGSECAVLICWCAQWKGAFQGTLIHLRTFSYRERWDEMCEWIRLWIISYIKMPASKCRKYIILHLSHWKKRVSEEKPTI